MLHFHLTKYCRFVSTPPVPALLASSVWVPTLHVTCSFEVLSTQTTLLCSQHSHYRSFLLAELTLAIKDANRAIGAAIANLLKVENRLTD